MLLQDPLQGEHKSSYHISFSSDPVADRQRLLLVEPAPSPRTRSSNVIAMNTTEA